MPGLSAHAPALPPAAAPAWPRALMWALAAAAFANAAAFAWTVANPMVMADNWIFVDSFLRHVLDGDGDLGDFLVKRSGFDHGLPHYKLAMLLNAWWFGLDFRYESVAGAVFALLGWWVLVRAALSDAAPVRWSPALALVLGAIAAVQLSLNAYYTWLYSMVALGYVDYLLAFLAFAAAWPALSGGRWWPFAAWTLLYAVLADTSATIAALAVAIALVFAGWKLGRLRRALALVGLVVAAVALSRVVYATFGEIRGETLAIFDAPLGARISGLLAQGTEAWRWVAAPLASGIAWRNALRGLFGDGWQPVQVALALAVLPAHAWFWWRALRDRPRAASFVAVCLMLLFYGYVAGVLYGRVFVRGATYLDQGRYAALYQIGIMALLLMAASRLLDLPAAASRLQARCAAAAASALLLVQLPLSWQSWGDLPDVHAYYRVMAAQYGAVARAPAGPDRDCVDQLTVCGLGEPLRLRAIDLLRRHRLNLFAPEFATRHPDLAAAAGPLAPAAPLPPPPPAND